MIILTTSSSSQQLKVIPRTFANNFTFRTRDNSTNTVKDYEVTSATTSGNYLVVNQAFSPVLVENRFYDLEYKLFFMERLRAIMECRYDRNN